MNFIIQIVRVFVGVLFIISGLIKLNDPVGFSYKLEEYFSESVLNLPSLEPLALSIALFVVIVEVVLGVMLLVGYRVKQTLWLLLLMILFFTFLTFYSAYFNKVTDCGCFGDVLKLTPWQSFGKDVLLLVLIILLFAGKKYIKSIFSNPKISVIVVAVSLFLCVFMGYWVLNHLPLKDFRPYKKGVNIAKAMEIPEDAPKSEYEINFVYEVDGKPKTFDMNQLDQIPEGAKFLERNERLIKEGFTPAIQGFMVEKDNEDYTDVVLGEEKIILVITYDIEKADSEGLEQVAELIPKAKELNYKIIGLASNSDDVISPILAKYGVNITFFQTDKIVLKTIERANPSLVILNKGTIMQKVHWKDIDDLKL
ncbi:MAG: DoxX family membrane protein [Bacteroidota bacterium]|nr:DoxX family membrane protein [Bacteroidota bacterium]